ncbi:MAG: carboxyl transferase domain-containing protein, partial [Clostridia bacterium]
MIEKVNELRNKKQEASLGGGQQRIEAQKMKGKNTATDRIYKLFDEGSFVETEAFTESRSVDFDMSSKRKTGDGVICGYGRINGRPVFAVSQDYTVLHGSVGEMHAKKIARTIDMAVKTGVPIVYMLDSDGARVEEGTDVLAGIGELLTRQSMASGVIPQVCAVLGNCAGTSSLFSALSDFVIMSDKTSYMYMNGPAVIESVTGAKVTKEDIGSAS